MAVNNKFFTICMMLATFVSASSQVQSAGGVRKLNADKEKTRNATSQRILNNSTSDAPESGIEYQRDIYRQLDLTKTPNAALYYPEDVIDGQKNLFRIILERVAAGDVAAYEFLDGREIFTDQYKIDPAEMLKRFGIPAKISGKKNLIEEADVPSSQVQTYYIIEKWQFDNFSNSMKTKVWALCPVLTQLSDYGESMKYPMFWIRFDDIRPYIVDTFVFPDDDNNLARYSLTDFFTLNLYNGDIYKTRNLRNLTMQEIYPDEDDRKLAQDSIDHRLRTYGQGRWTPTREEYLQELKTRQESANDDEIAEKTTVTSKDLQKALTKKSRKRKVKKSETNDNSNAERSVRRRRR